MTRVKISVAILSTLIIVSIFSGISINRRCDEFIRLTEDIRTSMETGDTENALKTAEALQDKWEDFRHTASIMVKSDKIAEISCVSARIAPLISSESDEISAELEELIQMLIALRRGEKPELTSVF